MRVRIMWIEGKRAESPSFISGLRKKGYSVEVVSTGNEALARLASFDPDLAVINASSMRTTGKRICRSLREKNGDLPILVILNSYLFGVGLDFVDELDQSKVSDKLREQFQEHGKPLTPLARLEVKQAGSNWTILDTDIKYCIRNENQMLNVHLNPEQSTVDYLCANVVLVLPFTTRKLLNRLSPLLPGDGGNLLHHGPIRLDMARKRVRCQGREESLTPRLAQLLKIFIEHPGEALERKRLFREVWNTEYIGDTRTLDVHISWLRQALEEDPRKPRFLKTIRGVGYRLDL